MVEPKKKIENMEGYYGNNLIVLYDVIDVIVVTIIMGSD